MAVWFNKEKEFYIGIDLGGKEKRTTGICVFEEKEIVLLKDVFGKNVLRVINPYLKETKVIAIDAPLTRGRGKGKMRLYEKFLSTKIFRKERVNPIPPALMPELCDFARELVQKLEKKGFVLDLNLIEVFPTMVEKMVNYSQLLKTIIRSSSRLRGRLYNGIAPLYQTENQKMALICAVLAFLHFNFQTRYLGYKDGFLFLPEISFWKKDWKKKFYQAWMERSRLRYKHLITNVFSKQEIKNELRGSS